MNVALGYELEVLWEELAWSSNSGFLMVAASDVMAAQARRRGDDPEPFEELASRAKRGLEEHFLMPDGSFAALQLFDGSGDPTPFEDAALKALWSGAYTADDPVAVTALRALVDRVGRGDGSIQSPVAPRWRGNPLVPVDDGYLTGMEPGYALANFSAVGDLQADAAFRQVDAYALSSGHFAEGMVYDDRSAVHPYYDGSGGLGDISARYRPWEGSIVVDAMVAHLVGVEPTDGVVTVRPHLPDGLRQMTASGVTVPGGELTVDCAQDDGALSVQVSVTSGEVVLLVEIPLPSHVPVEAVLRSDGELVQSAGGRWKLVFDQVALSGGAQEWLLEWLVEA